MNEARQGVIIKNYTIITGKHTKSNKAQFVTMRTNQKSQTALKTRAERKQEIKVSTKHKQKGNTVQQTKIQPQPNRTGKPSTKTRTASQ